MFITKNTEKFSFIVGNKQYCLTSPLPREQMEELLERVNANVMALPPYLTQDEKLLLTLLTLTADFDTLEKKLKSIVTNLS
ncbi:MAG: hypothetical protein Q4C78_00100 [Synergistaceae bacterium]|nr:hypothetical protein [Synergistaceae bacterium]